MSFSLSDAWSLLKEDVWKNQVETEGYWLTDSMLPIYKRCAPEWKAVRDFADVQEVSLGQNEAPEGFTAVFIHSKVNTINDRLPTGNLADKYLMESSYKSLMHRVCHHHFGLSSASLEGADTIILGLAIDENVIVDEGSLAINGYCRSIPMSPLQVDDTCCKLMSPIRINPGLKRWLQSASALNLTRQTVSHYDAFMTTTALSENRPFTLEMVKGLMLEGCAGQCSKITATVAHQTPEVKDAIHFDLHGRAW
eukprot:1006840-Amphidinium_carterae.2